MKLQIFNTVPFVDKLLFTKHLSIMVKSGIPLTESLAIVRDQCQNGTFKKILSRIYDDISNGHHLHEAVAKFPLVFDRTYQSLITAAEESGNLEKNLDYLAIQLQKKYEFDRKVKGAMLYPTIVFIMAIMLGGGLAIFVLPQLANLFGSLNINLPLSTKILLAISSFTKVYGFALIPAGIILFALFKFLVNQPLIKPIWHSFLLNLPIFGKFSQEAELASICCNLGLMLKSGLPISDAFGVTVESTGNLIFRSSLIKIKSAVDRGKTVESELSSGKHWEYPLIMGRMIGVGEKTGKLDDMFLYLGDFFEEDVDAMAKNLPTILEPLLLTSIALVVAFVAMAIISPIYQFTSGIK